MGNNSNKDNNKNLILNNNIHKYYVNSNHENHDCFQSHMAVHNNPKAQSGTINFLWLLNNQVINNNNNNKSFNNLNNHKNLKTSEENSGVDENLGTENNITNTNGIKNIIHNRISKELLFESKIELSKENNIVENKEF